MIEGVAHVVRQLAGRYEVGDLIGRGGMADVYVGTDSRLGRRVAIKLLKPALANDPAFRSRFRREAQDAAKMAHPTIVRIFDAGEETIMEAGGVETLIPFIVMEFVDGRLLKDVVADGPLESAEASRIIGQVLTALEYSHRAGVVHRDVKPGNIMITGSGQVKVMDFGIARAISETSATIAETSTIVGTAQYFSPEQARGEAVDARSDLYSTGVVLYELLTGRAPFRGANPVAVAYQHVNSDAVPPSATNPKVSPALDAVVLRALSKDKFERYQSASEFRHDVETAAAGEVPARKQLAVGDFNSTLFGVNPSSVRGSEATLRQLTVEDDRAVRTQNRPPVAWVWAGIASLVVIIGAVLFWTFTLAPPPPAANVSADVPGIVGQTYDEGLQALRGDKLDASKFEEPSTTVAPGVIIRTDPVEGQSVAIGYDVRVYVSSGPPLIKVPALSRMSEADAILAIEAVGLVYGSTTTAGSADLPGGTVIQSVPAETLDVALGGEVNLVVSDGLVDIPDVTGQALKAASDTLSALQLDVRVNVDTGCTGAVVTSQSIVGKQPQRSAVTLRYCAG